MIYRSTVRNIVSAIVIFGHVSVFFGALGLGVFSVLHGTDALQTLLMASPILSVVALAAFSYVMDSNEKRRDDSTVNRMFATLCIAFPVLLISVIGLLFYLFYIQYDKFGPDQLKVTLGGVETFFGVFIGAISKALYGAAPE